MSVTPYFWREEKPLLPPSEVKGAPPISREWHVRGLQARRAVEDFKLEGFELVMQASRVLVADDQLMNRNLLRRLFKTQFGVADLMEACSAEEVRRFEA